MMKHQNQGNVNSADPKFGGAFAPSSDDTQSRPLNDYPRSVIRVANSEIGKLIAANSVRSEKHWGEKSKAKAYGLRELFMKAHEERFQADGRFASNRKHQDDQYSITDWQYRQQRHFAKRAMDNYDRKQDKFKHGVVFASERALASWRNGYVEMPVSALQELDAKVFSFIVVVLLRKNPQRPRDVAREIGLVDDQVISRLTAAAAKSGLIKKVIGVRRTVWVGRQNADFSPMSRALVSPILHPPVSNPPVFPTAHREDCKQDTISGNQNRTGKGSASRIRTPLLRSWTKARENNYPRWRGWHGFEPEDFQEPTAADRIAVPPSIWTEQVERLGPVPVHLNSDWAYAQALDLVRQLLMHAGYENIDYWLPRGLRGFAGIVAGEYRDGRDIRNFACLVDPILAAIDDDNDTWIFDVPTRLSPAEAKIAQRDAETLVKYAQKLGHRVNVREFTSTFGREALHDLLNDLADGDRKAGWAYLVKGIEQTAKSDENWEYSHWECFRERADTARRQSAMSPADTLDDCKRLIQIAGRWYRHDEKELSSPAGLEDLHKLLLELGHSDVNLGWKYLVRGINKRWQLPEDRPIIRWSWFRPQAEACRKRSEAAKRAAETRRRRR